MITPRAYQERILETAKQYNTLVVLPTGMGKTLIAEMLIMERLNSYPGSKAILLAPTKPLVQQHFDTFLKETPLTAEECALFTGSIAPAKRANLWERARVVFSTPQGLENDIISGRVSLAEVSCLVVDECHRAVGDYAYVFIADRYQKQSEHERILGLTASPGSDKESIEMVCRNLGVERIEARTAESPDVAPYVQEIDIEHVKVAMPDAFKGVHEALLRCFTDAERRIRELGVIDRKAFANKGALLKAQAALHAAVSRGQKDYEALKSLSVLAEAMKVQHAIELIETQGVSALSAYLRKLDAEAVKGTSKAVKSLVGNVDFKTAKARLATLREQAIEHPKIRAIKKLMLQEMYGKEVKVIIFTQYRDQAVVIQKELTSINIDSRVFVGQLKKGETGMSQKEQHAILESFRAGDFPCLIATSVAEEGLDIPKVDLVIFYEPVPSAIRTVQRRGRTGRLEKGRVVMLVTENTRDTAYRWVAHHKERRMHRLLGEVGRALPQRGSQRALTTSTLAITADHREKASGVLKQLLDAGVNISLSQLETGDYLLSDRVCVEYKRVPDFVNSIIDGRLLGQLRDLRRYPRALLIIEGAEDIFSVRNVHRNAIQGMLATIAVSYNIPVLFTRDASETASLMTIIARREQEQRRPEFRIAGQRPTTPDEVQERIASSLPAVGPALARKLLAHFRTLRALATASVEELEQVERLGAKRARGIEEAFTRAYDSPDRHS